MVLEVVHEQWVQILDSTGLSDQMIFGLGTAAVLTLTFWAMNFCLYIIYHFNLFSEYKIQPSAEPDSKLVQKCLVHCVISHFLVAPVMLYFAYPAFAHFGMTIRGDFPSAVTVIRDFVAVITVNDTVFYWVHRALHHKSIYKYIHKQHHLFKVPIGISAIYAHPVEDLLANIIPTIGGCLLMGSHILVLWVWLFIRMMETVDAHSGYSFTMSPFHLLPFQGGADRHDYHHSHNVGCYGSFTIFWDHVMGTDEAFKAFQKAKNVAKKD